jgi:hypothetical protein
MNWKNKAVGLACFVVAGCSAAQHAPTNPTTHSMSADEALALQSRVTDCEWKAADQYDDGHRTITELARQVMGVCSVERTKSEIAFGLLNDPEIDTMELEQAVNAVEGARASRAKWR